MGNARLLLIGIGAFVVAFVLFALWGAWPAVRWLWQVWEAL